MSDDFTAINCLNGNIFAAIKWNLQPLYNLAFWQLISSSHATSCKTFCSIFLKFLNLLICAFSQCVNFYTFCVPGIFIMISKWKLLSISLKLNCLRQLSAIINKIAHFHNYNSQGSICSNNPSFIMFITKLQLIHQITQFQNFPMRLMCLRCSIEWEVDQWSGCVVFPWGKGGTVCEKWMCGVPLIERSRINKEWSGCAWCSTEREFQDQWRMKWKCGVPLRERSRINKEWSGCVVFPWGKGGQVKSEVYVWCSTEYEVDQRKSGCVVFHWVRGGPVKKWMCGVPLIERSRINKEWSGCVHGVPLRENSRISEEWSGSVVFPWGKGGTVKSEVDVLCFTKWEVDQWRSGCVVFHWGRGGPVN
jgi:hypothetical protein